MKIQKHNTYKGGAEGQQKLTRRFHSQSSHLGYLALNRSSKFGITHQCPTALTALLSFKNTNIDKDKYFINLIFRK